MKQNDTAVTISRDGDGYTEFSWNMIVHFNTYAGKPLFTTNAQGLWDAFLANLPAEGRQHYTCNHCRHFVERYGGLVYVNEKGIKTSVIWGKDQPTFFQKSVDAMLKLIQASEIEGVFISQDEVYGQPITGEWHHMHVNPAPSAIWSIQKPNAYQRTAAMKEDFKVLQSSLQEYGDNTIKQALKLLEANALYRGEKILGVAKWFKSLRDQRKVARKNADNMTWLAVALAPQGFCHVKNSMIGTLLDDIVEGLDFEAVTRRFQAKMALYQRSSVAPTVGNIQRGEEIIRDMNAAGSLQRRYATWKDIQEFVWVPKALKKSRKSKAQEGQGVFADITPRAKPLPQPSNQIEIPATLMTWAKFSSTILPNATALALKVPATPERFAALVTAVNQNAPAILQWDTEEKRNPVSWYYAAGVDAEIRRRVLNAGGQHENVDIRASLIWNDRNDLDLHCITPGREEIYYHHTRSVCGGWLDVDMNVHGETTTPVENIRWARGHARPGLYRFYVQNYRFHESAGMPTSFKVELQVEDKIFSFESVVPAYKYGEISNIVVFEFNYVPGQPLNLQSTANVSGQQNNWNMIPNVYVPVTGIVLSPNLWGSQPQPQHGSHVFFLLDGCRDMDGSQARGFFSESLKNEYREIRSVLEAYNVNAGVEGADKAQACGVGMSTYNEWDLTLRVTTDAGTNDYKLDRWD